MEKEQDKTPKEKISENIQDIMSKMKDEKDLSLWNGQSKKKVTQILIKTENLLKTFLKDDDEKPFLEFIDSDPEIADFLTQPRLCLTSDEKYHATQNSIVSYMRKQLTEK